MPANLATIKVIYGASGKGDVETILGGVADGVDWAVDAEPVASWYGQRNGKDGVVSFFARGATQSSRLANPALPDARHPAAPHRHYRCASPEGTGPSV